MIDIAKKSATFRSNYLELRESFTRIPDDGELARELISHYDSALEDIQDYDCVRSIIENSPTYHAAKDHLRSLEEKKNE
jgi:hypothetical protein